MKDSELKSKLEKALASVNNITGVDGTLVVDNQGEILYSNISYKDVDLFGSMANIISSSSEKLLDLSKEGQIERVLVESVRGKALFLSLIKAHLVVLTNIKANIGMVILSSKKSANFIKEMKEIRDIPDYVEVEPIPEPVAEIKVDLKAEPEPSEELKLEEEITVPPVKEVEREIIEARNESKVSKSPSRATADYLKDQTDTEILASQKSFESSEEIKKPPEIDVVEKLDIKGPSKESEDLKPPKMEIPVIKPPLSFPPLPESVSIPENLEEKSRLITDIYESVLLAMSIGASKIMGTAPARGMLKNSIPYEDCPELLDDVDVRSNSALQFDVIRENLEKFPLEERTEKTIDDFTIIISAITDKYGRVMGYDAFRGMIRPEFKKIYDSFGPAMEELGIKEKIHPELRKLLVS
ncbi:MAG: roadblock/LC7 domain-containing protein [Methanobacteriaceae archaeon]|nr:roadblock/LC7 domain-containing protein [Methanobacteriaceae archaeon]MDP2836788.1 roadblock/LC7 domain-containing protein [Methanobacteriaceae archaeon]MDP3033976.1 roadblock/LC7 domain-containing protein [Methanobacteriaceae archaeon]MDP3484247.1 roadblock/LC7 domain-containing protein [Methanobacteriaceae archaeon]